ncbi:mechanosensitive ion channel [Sphingomonas sp. CGMCC 1.13654]|uniref:Mechanosensitive ion channel n=1 Tax=Sphingomonas chungangi TaxID=2683589 RepID=A0A838L658_9SPHN|nr:mechanosensitive ion channel domain-containing protein [Sphingomonas chungangi]MBA2933949.1 mechanosensitive ion channel [Sphingomonas chungangi]MVW57076.1 mechanosensitive ion channel [Sphingomonas chungangi]
MNWLGWLQRWGIPIPHSPDLGSIVLAIVTVVGAYWLGWLAGTRIGPRIAALSRRWMGRSDDFGEKLAAALSQFGSVSLILLIAGNSARLSPLGLMIVAVGLGVSLGVLAYRLAKALSLGTGAAAIIATVCLVATTAGTLGGMQPLIAGLNGIGLTVGKNRISLLGVVNFVVVAVILYAIARIANRVLMHSIGRMHALDVSQRALIQKLASIAVIAVAILFGVDLLGIDLTALTVFSGAAGLAIGFGLQTTFGNLIAGLILLMDRSVKPGDVIAVGDTFGQVTRIGVRAVSVVTRDGKEHILPNQKLMTDPVENWSFSSRNVRVHIKVGVGYDSDLKLAQKLMIEAAMASPRALSDPKPSVWLTAFGDSSVDHEILVWISDPEAGVGNVRSDVLNRLWFAFKENGIEIPYPQREVHIRAAPGPTIKVEN